MANNRMYLVHKPSGYYVYLGKRMGEGWYDSPCENIQKLFDAQEKYYNWIGQDDYVIVDEDVNLPINKMVTCPAFEP